MRTFTSNQRGTIFARDTRGKMCCSGSPSALCPTCRAAWDVQQRPHANALGLPGSHAALRELRHDEVRDADGFVWNLGCWGELPEQPTADGIPDPWARPTTLTTPDPLDPWARREATR